MAVVALGGFMLSRKGTAASLVLLPTRQGASGGGGGGRPGAKADSSGKSDADEGGGGPLTVSSSAAALLAVGQAPLGPGGWAEASSTGGSGYAVALRGLLGGAKQLRPQRAAAAAAAQGLPQPAQPPADLEAGPGAERPPGGERSGPAGGPDPGVGLMACVALVGAEGGKGRGARIATGPAGRGVRAPARQPTSSWALPACPALFAEAAPGKPALNMPTLPSADVQVWSVTASLDKLGMLAAPSVSVFFAGQRAVIGGASLAYTAVAAPQLLRLLRPATLPLMVLISGLELAAVVLFLKVGRKGTRGGALGRGGQHPSKPTGARALSRPQAVMHLLVSYVVAIKRCNVLLSVLVGGLLFRERILERLPYVLLMMLGMCLIVLEPGVHSIVQTHT